LQLKAVDIYMRIVDNLLGCGISLSALCYHDQPVTAGGGREVTTLIDRTVPTGRAAEGTEMRANRLHLDLQGRHDQNSPQLTAISRSQNPTKGLKTHFTTRIAYRSATSASDAADLADADI
jgi:hypothetical protein